MEGIHLACWAAKIFRQRESKLIPSAAPVLPKWKSISVSEMLSWGGEGGGADGLSAGWLDQGQATKLSWANLGWQERHRLRHAVTSSSTSGHTALF